MHTDFNWSYSNGQTQFDWANKHKQVNFMSLLNTLGEHVEPSPLDVSCSYFWDLNSDVVEL